ncbi:unnamed protein product, partial [Discosporangium mesarthrocarpum]
MTPTVASKPLLRDLTEFNPRSTMEAREKVSTRQRSILSPVQAYFNSKRVEREQRDLEERRFIRSVLDVIRAEERDQNQWKCRQLLRIANQGGEEMRASSTDIVCRPKPPRHGAEAALPQSTLASGGVRTGAATGENPSVNGGPGHLKSLGRKATFLCTKRGDPSKSMKIATSCSSAKTSPAEAVGVATRSMHAKLGHQKKFRGANACRSKATGQAPQSEKELAQTATRVQVLKQSLAKSPDPPAVAMEIALEALALGDVEGALKYYRVAKRRSPPHVLSEQDKENLERHKRRLLLVDETQRAELEASFKAAWDAEERVRVQAQASRVCQAMTGEYRCLLDLGRPVEAATAARARLEKSGSPEERMQVREEIHRDFFQNEGLVEPAATNQGAWLTGSAGAVADLHASVLEEHCRHLREHRESGGATWGPARPHGGHGDGYENEPWEK